MISHIASYILIFPVPERRIKPVTFSSTGDCDTCNYIQDFFLTKKNENDESSSHRRQQTAATNRILLSIYLFILAELLSFDLVVKEGLGLLMKNS